MFPVDHHDHLLDEHRRRVTDAERRAPHLLASRCRLRRDCGA